MKYRTNPIRGALWRIAAGLSISLLAGHCLAPLFGESAFREVKCGQGRVVANDQFAWRVASPILAGVGVLVGATLGISRDGRLSRLNRQTF